MGWEIWKKGFDAWENATAQAIEAMLKSPWVLVPSGAVLSAVMKAKAASDASAARWWASMGLATRRDQERTLHALHQLQSRLMDLEEKLADKGVKEG